MADIDRKPPCPDCGEMRWAAAGYCLSIPCAGHYKDHDYPKTAPEELKWNRSNQPTTGRNAPKPKVPKPPKKGRRALEIQYEARGEIAPWLQRARVD